VLKPRGLECLDAALGNDQRALPIVAAIDQYREAAALEAAAERSSALGRLADPKPENVHRRAERFHLEHSAAPDNRRAAIGGNDERRSNRPSVGEAHAAHPPLLFDHALDGAAHLQLKTGED
jgi:hypothetical protein